MMEGLRRRVIMQGRIIHRRFITVNEPGRSCMYAWDSEANLD